jgi:hypothetical protein
MPGSRILFFPPGHSKGLVKAACRDNEGESTG